MRKFPQIPFDDPRVLVLAKARQQLAHDGTGYVPTWEELTDDEREGALPAVRNYLESAINAGLVPAVDVAAALDAILAEIRDRESYLPDELTNAMTIRGNTISTVRTRLEALRKQLPD